MSIISRTGMVGRFESIFAPRWLGAFIVAALTMLCLAGQASAETRSLKLYFIHTKERAEIVYKRNGRYDQKGLKQINQFLRDWRRNEATNMDPRLLDLVWEVYRSVGAREHIHVVSAYRSPATNSMLRSRSSGVAQKSQHTLGKAIDFYIPGVPLSKLRAAAFKVEGGGVGYYPKSGSPFVHLDVGNVRSWPRMSRSELVALFPNGKTLHVPADGKPLPGYNQALAAYKARQKSGGEIHIASAPTASEKSRSGGSRGGGGGLLATLFGGGADEDEDNSQASASSARAVAAAPVPSQPVAPAANPVPQGQTIIAALPERNAPLPGAAPRPLIDIGAPAQAALVAGLPSNAAPIPTPAAVPVPAVPVPAAAGLAAASAADSSETGMVALAKIPLPTRRPDYAYAPEPELRVASAELPETVNLPVTAIAAERTRGSGSNAITELLAASSAQARADVVVNTPAPSERPDNQRALAEMAASDAAALPQETPAPQIFALAALPDTNAAKSNPVAVPAPAGLRHERSTASPRIAVLGRANGTDAAAALESGVRTTAKAPRPQPGSARSAPKPVVAPVQNVARIAFLRDVTVATAGGVTAPDKAHQIVHSAPQTIYTQGFSRSAPAPDTDRFSGNAVTFLSVARFTTN